MGAGRSAWQPEMGAERSPVVVGDGGELESGGGRKWGWGGVRRLPEMEMSGVRWRPEIEMERRTPAAGDRGRVDECDLEIEA
jgi:hypothetical protein